MQKSIIIRDSVHKTIRISPSIRKLLDCRPVQRLRFISQLGFVNLLYPGANGNRLEHSIGTFYLAGQITKRLQNQRLTADQKRDFIQLTLDDFVKLQVSALLHDIGHAPFSHLISELPWYDHEQMTCHLIKSTEIKEILDEEFGGITDSICNIIVPTQTATSNELLLHDILSGPLSIDMLDYLQRDALYTGVPYGRIDSDRLFEVIELDPLGRPHLIINDKGVLPVESIFFSRYQMQTSVYQHHVTRVSQRMLQEAIQLLQNNQNLSVNEIAQLTDSGFLQFLESNLPKPIFDQYVTAVLNRQLYKRIYELSWSALESHGRSSEKIIEYISSYQNPVNRTRKENSLITRYHLKNRAKDKGHDLLLDVPPLVTKSVSSILVRKTDTPTTLIPLRDPSISAIGSYIERAYQLIWKTRLYGDPKITSLLKGKLADIIME